MDQLAFDENTANQLSAAYRTRDAVHRRRLVREALGVTAGDRILDVGCGPGFFAEELLEQVGPEGSVLGVDSSAQMLELAMRRCRDRANVTFQEADATSLQVDAADFDAALCVQVLEYVPDVTAALAELHRALRVGGRAVVWDSDWATVSWHSSDPARMERVLRAWDAHLAHPTLPRTLGAQLRAAGFDGVDVQGHVFASGEFDPETFGVALMPLIEEFVSGRDESSQDEARAWATEQRELGERGEFFFTYTQFCFTATRTES